MIKEYSYYITTGRFSQIAEDLENSMHEYAESFGSGATGDPELREKARLLCEEHLVKSGLRTENNSFINIDSEFFDNGEFVEENLNRFIKDILKAHSYQKILWEYMGTTGLMTDISKRCMKNDGFVYEKYLPASLKQKEVAKQNERLKFEYNKLKDNSGFDWSKSYDPNYSVEKIGWKGAFDKNGVWNCYKTDENGMVIDEDMPNGSDRSILKIQLIKTEHGAMLYDAGELLLNPIILWFLTHENEVYGGEESDTAKIIENLREQMKVLGIKKITEIACSSNLDSDIEIKKEEYLKVLGELADPNLVIEDKKTAEKLIEQADEKERLEIIQNKNEAFQKKINSITAAKPEITADELSKALEGGTVSIPLNAELFEDAQKAGLTDDEYKEFRELLKSVPENKKSDFVKAVTSLSSGWKNYSSCGKTKKECMKMLSDFVQKDKKSTFSYEKNLSEVIHAEGLAPVNETEKLVEVIKSALPAENQVAAEEYIRKLPAQKPEVKNQVFAALQNAITNYLTIRSCTGMSIKELLDYAVKSSSGQLPKESFVPVTGYITPGAKPNAPEGNKRILFEKDSAALYEELLGQSLPEKEVSITELEKQYEEQNKEKPVIKISSKNLSDDFEMIYDSGDVEGINPAVAAMLRKLMVRKTADIQSVAGVREVSVAGSSVGAVGLTAASKAEILTFAKKAKTPEEFVSYLKNKFNIDYDFTDAGVRELYSKQNSALNTNIMEEYAHNFESESASEIKREGYVSHYKADVNSAFKQVDYAGAARSADVASGVAENALKLPEGFRGTNHRTTNWTVNNELSVMQQRRYENKAVPLSKKAESLEASSLSKSQKAEVTSLIKNMGKAEREEMLHSAGGDWNQLSPVFVKNYLNRKQNGHLAFDDFNSVMSGSGRTAYAGQSGSSGGTGARTVKVSSKSNREHIDLETASGMSTELKEAFHNVIQKRTEHHRGGSHSGKSFNSENLSPEELKMQRINANYEYDKAVLAKNDPAFMAKNQFWDVGHAEESGIISERDKEKLSKRFAGKKFEDLN